MARARFVVDEDYAYYDLPGRRVFKIHGSTRSVSTLIATEQDYKRRERDFRSSAMGSSLKHFLATEVVVFVGYSLADPDFQSIYRGLLSGLGRSRPPAFLVSPFPSPDAAKFGLEVIQTDGTFFMHTLKNALVEADELFADSVLDDVATLHARALHARRIIEVADWRSNPALFFSLSYLDGVVDAVERNLVKASSGESLIKDHVAHIIRSYDRLLDVAVEAERWWDAAYVDGYRIALYAFFMNEDQISEIEMFQAFDRESYPGIAASQDDDEEADAGVIDERASHLAAERTPPADVDPHEVVRRFDESQTTARESIWEQFRELSKHFGSPGVPRHSPFLDELMAERDARGHAHH